MGNVFAGGAGLRSVPTPLCPGTQLWQELHGCSRSSLATCALALSKPCLQTTEMLIPTVEAAGQPEHEDIENLSSAPATPPPPAVAAPCSAWASPGTPQMGAVNEAVIVLSNPSPATTCLLSTLKGQTGASLVSDCTAAEMLLPTPMSCPGSFHSEVNRSQYPAQSQDKLCLSPACCCLLITCPSITQGCAVLEQRDGEAGTAKEDQLLSQVGSPPGRGCLEPLLPSLAVWPRPSCPLASDLKDSGGT